MAGAGYWMAASHLSRACGSVVGDGVGTEENEEREREAEDGRQREREEERNRERETEESEGERNRERGRERVTRGIRGAAGECLEVEDVRACGGGMDRG